MKITDYKCGHNSKPVVMNDGVLIMVEYLTWLESTGFEGDSSECFDCFMKRVMKCKGEVEE